MEKDVLLLEILKRNIDREKILSLYIICQNP